MKQIDLYAVYMWDCPLCDAANTTETKDIKIVTCCRCQKQYEVAGAIGDVSKMITVRGFYDRCPVCNEYKDMFAKLCKKCQADKDRYEGMCCEPGGMH